MSAVTLSQNEKKKERKTMNKEVSVIVGGVPTKINPTLYSQISDETTYTWRHLASRPQSKPNRNRKFLGDSNNYEDN